MSDLCKSKASSSSLDPWCFANSRKALLTLSVLMQHQQKPLSIASLTESVMTANLPAYIAFLFESDGFASSEARALKLALIFLMGKPNRQKGAKPSRPL